MNHMKAKTKISSEERKEVEKETKVLQAALLQLF
jgi:hypothetical protein